MPRSLATSRVPCKKPLPTRSGLTRRCICVYSAPGKTWSSQRLACTFHQSDRVHLKCVYPQVAKWIVAEFEVTPKINSLLDVAVAEDTAILVINSDIEIYGDQSRLTDLVANRKNGFGIRHNYETQPGDATIEQWGLDAFLVYPAQVRRLSRVEFSIGKPMWDYWLPWELEQIEECEWITIPYFFHRSHPVAWTQEECTSAHEAFAAQFGPMDWTQWRGARPRD